MVLLQVLGEETEVASAGGRCAHVCACLLMCVHASVYMCMFVCMHVCTYMCEVVCAHESVCVWWWGVLHRNARRPLGQGNCPLLSRFRLPTASVLPILWPGPSSVCWAVGVPHRPPLPQIRASSFLLPLGTRAPSEEA